jgi:hypothetical protein
VNTFSCLLWTKLCAWRTEQIAIVVSENKSRIVIAAQRYGAQI